VLVCNLDPQPMEMRVCGTQTLEDVAQLMLAHTPTFKCTSTLAPHLLETNKRHDTQAGREATVHLQREDGEWGQLEPGAPHYIHGLRR